MYYSFYESPIGNIQIFSDGRNIVGLYFVESASEDYGVDVLYKCINQLDEYFKGKRKQFNIPIAFDGTAFQNKVWRSLMDIPYGETRSYKDIASTIENIRAVRAVGSANHNNRISVIVPCHRVVATDGSLTGYSGGLDRKQWLLNHEKKFVASI